MPLPIVGNLVELFRKEVYQAQMDWHKNYGGMHTMWIGGMPVIMISDYKMINELFVKDGDAYAGRPVVPMELTPNWGELKDPWCHFRFLKHFAFSGNKKEQNLSILSENGHF